MNNPRHLLRLSGTKRLPLIMQTEGAECGLACLAMVAGYYGYKTDLTYLRQRYAISLQGATLEQLMEIADRMQLSSRALRVEISHLKQLTLPCIVHWDMNHFVVLKRVKRDQVELHDPSLGERTVKMRVFSNHFTGVALELSPTKGFKPEDTRTKMTLSDFWSSISGLKSALANLFILSLLLQLFVIASPYYLQLVIDEVTISHDKNLLIVLAMGFGALMFIDVVTSAVRSVLILHFGNLMSIQLGANLFHHLIRLPLQYFEKRHIGDVVSRFGSLQHVKALLTQGLIEAVVDGMMALITLVMIFIYSPLLSMWVLVAIVLYGLFRLVMYRPLRHMSEEMIINQAKEQSNFMETVRAIQAIKLFGREVQRQSLWHNRYADSLNSGIKVGHLTITYETFNKFIFGLENVLVVYFAALLVMDGAFSVGMMVAFMAYKRQFTEKMAGLIEKLIEFRMISLHFNRLADIALTAKETSLRGMQALNPLSGNLSVQQLTFRYNHKSPPIFSGLSFTIRAGESLALVGPSGCGKTTLIKILLGLFIPERGQIKVDGIEIHQAGLEEYRHQVAAVMQNDQLLSGSIAENISFFHPILNMKRIEWAANIAAVHQDIMQMPMGYNTLVGDMGAALSGGQIQRILLARALYKQPKILIMDEATSHLDTALESKVNSQIKALDITRIIIAHRPQTIASADRVIEINQGSLIEWDTPLGFKPEQPCPAVCLDVSDVAPLHECDPKGCEIDLSHC
ncbi:peptidase domain-containing ABC transporter [Alteromonas sp. C1M14]|uniref:peptidase domain-containing ABC transporter n=1 Tax=Alteromonas sp. C1M14 TaxID=2841567 RepID=UPI001C07FD9F|nr:peptidase domain-containing ABC transporter [Alteromonas sp. C1M14]MBU2977520.1 peptidase domain-containing ABC transporter [Alteromonas sp. C1M14]